MSNRFGPFNVAPRILQRSTNFVDLVIRDRPGTDMYRLWGAPSVNDAYGNPTGSGVGGTGGQILMTAYRGSIEQSQSLVPRGVQVGGENRKGHTTFQFNPDDFVIPAIPPNFNGDETPNYVRIQEHRAGAWLESAGPVDPGLPTQGPILIIPEPRFYGRPAIAPITFTATAPTGTGCTLGYPPVFDPTMQTPNPMHIVFPRMAGNIVINANDDGKALLVSYGPGSPMMAVTYQNPVNQGHDYGVGVSEIVIAAKTVAAPFTVQIYGTLFS